CCFFFQAEDGIRDFHVTGVQTCALPICRVLSEWHAPESEARIAIDLADQPKLNGSARLLTPAARALLEPAVETARPAQRWVPPRSEERRVGKECRSRWEPSH